MLTWSLARPVILKLMAARSWMVCWQLVCTYTRVSRPRASDTMMSSAGGLKRLNRALAANPPFNTSERACL